MGCKAGLTQGPPLLCGLGRVTTYSEPSFLIRKREAVDPAPSEQAGL